MANIIGRSKRNLGMNFKKKIYIDLNDDCCQTNDSSIIPGMEMETFSGAYIENQLKSHPLEKGTIIECENFRDSFNITINSVKEITFSYILYSGQKCQNEIIEAIEIVELFTYRNKRDTDGKTRLVFPSTMCIHGQENIPFYGLISEDTGFELGLIFHIFRNEHMSYENFICSNNTYYYIKKNRNQNFCKRCYHIYDIKNNYCPFCGIRVNNKYSRLKSLLNLFR